MTLLLPRVEAVLGPIERWPRTVLDQLFNDPPTETSVRDVAAFCYGNGVPYNLAYQLFDACNTMIMVSPHKVICTWYCTWQTAAHKNPSVRYYDVRRGQRFYVGREYEIADSKQTELGCYIPPDVLHHLRQEKVWCGRGFCSLYKRCICSCDCAVCTRRAKV